MAENVPPLSSKPVPVRSQGIKIEPPTQPRPQHMGSNKKNANLTVMSPVNQNGSFEFDRVIKAGTVVKRTRKTKAWKPIYLVLRPNLLSIYKDKGETKLRHQITLSEVTAVARQKDFKKKMEHVFCIFSPSRNYHLGAPTEKDASDWVDFIRIEARFDEDEEDMVLRSPGGNKTTFTGFDRFAKRDQVASSSSETEPRPSSSIAPENMHSARRPSQVLNYSGNEHGSFSDFSDTGGPVRATFQDSLISLPRTSQQIYNPNQNTAGATPANERVIYHGWLYVLKSKGGVRQWKKVWVVLRPKTLGLYKNEDEYSANLIIPFESIISAVDIDAVSRSKKHCMQVISEEKSFRFAAPDENCLSRWLGAFKSLLVKRKEAEQQKMMSVTSLSQPKPTAVKPPSVTTAAQQQVPPRTPVAQQSQQSK